MAQSGVQIWCLLPHWPSQEQQGAEDFIDITPDWSLGAIENDNAEQNLSQIQNTQRPGKLEWKLFIQSLL